MFNEDYLMRIINQVLAALMAAAGLRKAGRYEEARQAVDQAVEQLTTIPASVADGMDDSVLLSKLVENGALDVGRLEILADLYIEEAQIQTSLGMPVQAEAAYARALRFYLEVTLSEDARMTVENCRKVEEWRSRLKMDNLPPDTQLALSDYFLRLLEQDDPFLTSLDHTRSTVSQAQQDIQKRMSSTPYSPQG
jgi:hypothetical protein